GYHFGEYVSALESFVWGELADFYVELAKPALRGADPTEAVRVLAYVLDRTLRLAHPSIPFITETIALQLRSHARMSDESPSSAIRKPSAGVSSASSPKLRRW